ncbi:hypothetical protein MJO28_014624 [Puccinia striiformis f. sp. tritici]|uniref:Uncharacterized protein n=1 Tax=Puccinia striiformis f. sp. tritici TaxID=168172 RepID=A0ACC0DW52_9BASI|nr:hypothetical protein MJO28_014624 [Puccinia striiformis f. sp. tritici]
MYILWAENKRRHPAPFSPAEAQNRLNNSESHLNCESSPTESQEETNDSPFPYSDGPGHVDATAFTLKLIRQAMECCGIVLFCPDLAKTYGSLENSFLWDFAVNMFVKLVERGEYKGISLEQCDPNQFNVQSTNTSFIDGRSRKCILSNQSFVMLTKALSCSCDYSDIGLSNHKPPNPSVKLLKLPGGQLDSIKLFTHILNLSAAATP